ncbi:exopolysaccharide biosynthesis protein [Chelativorans sp. AA-79]|uniref:exopolysaccharide biosynthesis protein n=1 Tax=Chelativorans sp. AA-79 TaxID=3028735 RepID=UPI0023F701CA|nr:exopolysaccharide biosynthesis protein [Chelativorans sp. AA-79]WEX10179.1 exopolysaccharide biosynthesis protein [Chelativorans sp. AA-79]
MRLNFGDTSQPLRETIRKTVEAIDGRNVTLREIVELTGEQGLLLLCAILTLPFLLPVSIPGVSTVFGLAIILISVGITLNRAPWLPKRITDRPIDADKLIPTLRKGSEIVERIEKVIRPRIEALTTGAAINRFNGLVLVLGGVLLMFPLGLVPFSNTLPAFGILFLAVGISQRDGLFVLAGYGMALATIVYFSVLGYGAYMAGRGLTSVFGG